MHPNNNNSEQPQQPAGVSGSSSDGAPCADSAEQQQHAPPPAAASTQNNDSSSGGDDDENQNVVLPKKGFRELQYERLWQEYLSACHANSTILNKLGDCKKDIEQLKQNLRNAVNDRDNEIKQLKAALLQVSEQPDRKTTSDKLQHLVTDVKALAVEISKKIAEKEKAEESIAELNTDLATAESHGKRLEEIISQIEKKNVELEETEAALVELNRAISSTKIKALADTWAQQLQTFEARRDELEGEIVNLQVEMSDLSDQEEATNKKRESLEEAKKRSKEADADLAAARAVLLEEESRSVADHFESLLFGESDAVAGGSL